MRRGTDTPKLALTVSKPNQLFCAEPHDPFSAASNDLS